MGATELTELVREDEIKEIIVKTKINKTLRINAIIAGEYYKISKDELSPILYKVYNRIEFWKSWSEAIITVHPKE